MTDHVKDQLCQRIEELESEKMELNEQMDALQEERDSYQHQFARATDVLGEIHEALNGSGPAIVGMEAAQVRQLKGERDALAAHLERLQRALKATMVSGWSVPAEEALVEVFSDSPQTSLARLKSRWQAEISESLLAFRSAVTGWRENDWPEWFCRRTAEAVADRGRQAEGGEA